MAAGVPLEFQHQANTSTEMPVSGETQVRTFSRPHSDGGRMPQESAWCNFMLLGESASMRTLNTIQNATIETYEILSDQKVEDHLVCVDFIDNPLMQLDDQLTLIASDNKNYRNFLLSKFLVSEEEREELPMEHYVKLSSLEQEEARLTQELEELDSHHARVAAKCRSGQAKSKGLYQ